VLVASYGGWWKTKAKYLSILNFNFKQIFGVEMWKIFVPKAKKKDRIGEGHSRSGNGPYQLRRRVYSDSDKHN
jgi:hypothetical protein